MFWIFSVSHFNKHSGRVADCGPQCPCSAHNPLVVQVTWTEKQFTRGSGDPQGMQGCQDIQGSATTGAPERRGDGGWSPERTRGLDLVSPSTGNSHRGSQVLPETGHHTREAA